MRGQFLFVAAVLLILVAAIYSFDTSLRARTVASADTALAARARLIADTVDQMLQWRMTETFAFAALPSLRGFAASDDAARPARTATALVELKAIVAADQSIRAVSIIDPSGLVILTTDSSMNANWGDRVFVLEATAGHLDASAPSRDFGEVSQYYSAPIIDNAGDVAAELVMRVSAQELWNTLNAPPEALLVDENGVRVIDRTSPPQTFVALVPLAPDVAARVLLEKRYGVEVTQVPGTRLTALADTIRQNRTAMLSYQNADGKIVRAATQRISIYPWTVILLQDEETLLTPARDALIGTVEVSVAALVAGVILGIVFRKQGRAA
jgi:C4-dicarboxylate-specific signal transduction histidine kinase